jgi:protocadherin-16/23
VKQGTTVLNITTSDCDGGKNAEVQYKMNYGSYYDKDRYFRIQQENRIGYIVTNLPLDFEKTKIYKLQVIATDPNLQTTVEVTVSVRDENDNIPEVGSFHFYPIREDAKLNSPVAMIKISDKDSGNNGKLNVNLDPMNVFSISKFSQDIYHVFLNSTLDYENKKTYLIIVTATDNGKPPQTSQNSGTLLIDDVNDNPPKFDHNSYTTHILESEIPGTSVLTVTATDKDDSPNITYHILSSNTSWFGINSTSGAIYVASFIDREMADNVLLVIQAFDGIFTANCTVALRIIDSNDNAPQFSKQHYLMTVSENSMPQTFVGKVIASDVDLTSKGHISFALDNPTNAEFAINKTTGSLTTLIKLDREAKAMYNFSVLAQDEGGLNSTTKITVIVDDVNDNRPFFNNYFYNYTVYENISTGTDLIKLDAKDRDIGWNAQISYEIISGNDDGTFDLDKSNGQISLHRELDREKVDKYVLKFRAIDNGGLTSDKLATVQILVLDVNDDPPIFQKDKYSFSVKENSSVSVFVGTVQANSYDQGSGGIISYSIKSLDSQQHFSINDSGAIFTKGRLDHEVQSKYEILVEARDHGVPPLFGYVNVVVTVVDINDNFPLWQDYNHCIELEEDHSISDKVHVFNASDKDSGLNGKVTYNMVSGPESVFSLNSETGYLSLKMPVDYEQVQLYHLTVNASDSGKPALWSLLHVNICVIDVNDNAPILHNASITVDEDLPINALVYTFHAVDKDSGKNGKVWYNFVDNQPSQFELKEGNLTLKSPLDRETQDEHEVFVIAGDKGAPIKTSTPAKLTIHVRDVNDEFPVFTETLSFSTTENLIAGTLIGTVEAKDGDIGKNAEIEYSVINSTDFKIDSETGEIHNIVELDREKSPIYKVLVQASDKGNPPKMTRVTVDVHVQDVNDNAPKFTKSPYYANVAENAEKGTKVIQVEAVDRDEGQNGKVSYYHNTGNTQNGIEVFRINETTGSIYIVASLDREIKEFFVLSVVAKDNGSPLQESVCQVLVTVLDVNDHKPEFRVKNDTIYLSEKTMVGSIVYWANATDYDKDENGNIIYSIVKESGEQVFKINAKTGAVVLNKTLDYELTKQYSLRIRASDKAKDNPKKSILRLYINILDSNDNGPIFGGNNPRYAQVIEGAPRGTEFHEPILARDKDSGINSRIVYSIESQSPKAAFKIDPFLAQLSTDAEIDREDVREYRLVVKAVDQAGEVSQQKSSTVTVVVIITDINDCHPVFTSPNKSFIMEDEPVNFTIFYFTAEDKDSENFGNVTFSLIEGNEQGIFDLNPYWGSLTLKKALDREKVDKYQLKIRASDQGVPPLFSTITFTLSVVDVNDNLPRFSNYIYRVNVSENVNFAHVMKVKAKDLDSGELTYSLPPGFASDLFIINESTGQILTNSPLDREKQQMYELTVYVQDNGYPLYTDTATVKINVTDRNDNHPVVLQKFFEVKVLENTPAGYICSIVAQDLDTEMNAQLRYSIEEGNNEKYFQIDKKSGALSTLLPLDREMSSVHNLIINITDQGHPSLSTEMKLSVIVLDENDNNPEFTSNEMNIKLPGSSQPGTEVVTLTANDSDSNTAITYSFCSEQQVPFALDSTSGLIYTLNYFNASEVHMYSFCVNASDGSESGARFSSIKVNVFVDRITGIPLRFTKVLYEVDLDSKIKAGIEILQLQFKNKHLKAGDVEYIREGGQTVLAVGFTRGNVSFTEDPRPGAYLFSVRATLIHDRSMTAVCFVLVTVQRTIQRPSFARTSYRTTLNENDPPETPILKLKPKTSGNVSYQIVNGNTFDAFKIDSNGEVTVKKDNALDYERSRNFELDIKGDWGNTVTNIAFTKVHVSLRNLDDKAPEFRQKVFISSISESRAKSDNRFVTKLYAFNFGNSKLTFKIVSGDKDNVFSLDSFTGELFLQKTVDREEKKFYNLTISVSTGQLSSNCTVHVLVTDINDNSPQLPGRINLTMFENRPLGSHIGQVNATDKDDYSVLTYSFAGNMQRNGPFVIDLDTGILRLVEAVDFESKPNFYTLDVVVSDQVQKTSTTVSVTVLDENDHKPVFEKSSYGVKRKEPISPNTNLARINATDKDQGSNKRITYNITFNDEIGIDPNSGIVFTKKEIIYSKDFIDLIITATDHGSPKLSSQVPFRLQILHVNNRPPDLGNATYEVTISEDIEVGTVVERIKPLNSEFFKRISFQIFNGDELKMFRIEERTGIIRVRRQLDRENTDLYNLDVIAKDGGKSDISDRITVRIKISDVNDNSPIFQRNEYYVNDSVYEESISEDTVPPQLVLKVLAKDKDSGRNQEIKYSISSGNNGGWFSMKENELWLNKSLDRDVIPIHRLSVRATDRGK